MGSLQTANHSGDQNTWKRQLYHFIVEGEPRTTFAAGLCLSVRFCERTFRKASGKLQGSFREDSGQTQGTSGKIHNGSSFDVYLLGRDDDNKPVWPTSHA